MNFTKHSFQDVIMSVGTWNGFNITPQVLKDIAKNFKNFKNKFSVPLKIGHNEEQTLTDGQPALGWVDNVTLDNPNNPTELRADFVDMPTIVFEAIKAKLYRTRSIEIEDQMRDGKRVNNVLTAVAILGSDLPAVESLSDLGKYLYGKDFEDESILNSYKISQSRGTSVTTESKKHFSINIKGGLDMTELEKLQKELLEAQAKTSKLEADKVTLEATNKQFSDDKTTREADERKNTILTKRKGATDLLESAVKDKVITPAQRETFSKVLGIADDERVMKVELDDVKALIGEDKKSRKFSRKDTSMNTDGQNDDDDDDRDPSDILTEKAFALMDKTGNDNFEKSMFSVMRTNPKIAEAYKVQNGEYQ